MWPFGKKKEKPSEPSAQELQVQEFAQKFLPDEIVLVAVTGPEGVSDERAEGEALWTLTIPLTAWMDEDDGVVSTAPARAQILADDRLRSYLCQRLPGNFIIKARVRPGKEDGLFQLVGMPEPGFDPELKAILNEQVKPVTLETDDLGTFTLHRRMNWFETQTDWLGHPVQLTFNQGSDDDHQASLASARALLGAANDWDVRLRSFVVDHLLDTVNEQEDQPLSGDELASSLIPEAVHAEPNGHFTLWYGSDLFFGQAAQVSGTLEAGPTDARLEE
ncbi:MAG: DUF2262 domain-containing protein [Oscillospiraceae bacterium]|nr:DUF2262 domain-containing protein [Oscillospiraceae bacterium]